MIVLPQMRGVLAHHGAGTTEFVPTIKYAAVTSVQTTTSSTYSSLLTYSVTTASTSDCLNFVFTACGSVSGGGNSPGFQITVDGTSIGETVSTVLGNTERWNATRVASVTGLSAGTHTVVLNWKSANTNGVKIDPSTGIDHCELICRLATGTAYATLGSTLTSTASTLTDALVSTSYTSTQSTSALYIRFSAAGVTNASVTAKFQIFVDGVAAVGTADQGGGSGLAFNAGAVVIVPVTAGSHTIAVKWAGNNSTITITDPRQHAALLVDEVNTGSPRFAKCTTDVASSNNLASCSITTPAGGASAIMVEATASPDAGASGSPQTSLVLDGSTVQKTVVGPESPAGNSSLFLTYIGTGLSADAHTVTQFFVAGNTLQCATHPEYEHANIVVWPITVQP